MTRRTVAVVLAGGIALMALTGAIAVVRIVDGGEAQRPPAALAGPGEGDDAADSADRAGADGGDEGEEATPAGRRGGAGGDDDDDDGDDGDDDD